MAKLGPPTVSIRTIFGEFFLKREKKFRDMTDMARSCNRLRNLVEESIITVRCQTHLRRVRIPKIASRTGQSRTKTEPADPLETHGTL